MKTYLFIALGTLIGGGARYAAILIAKSANLDGFPWDTIAVNLLGSFLIGLLAAWFMRADRNQQTAHWEHFLMTGVCGGFTTFSFLSWQALQLWMDQAYTPAVFFALANVLGSLVAVTLGFACVGTEDNVSNGNS